MPKTDLNGNGCWNCGDAWCDIKDGYPCTRWTLNDIRTITTNTSNIDKIAFANSDGTYQVNINCPCCNQKISAKIALVDIRRE